MPDEAQRRGVLNYITGPTTMGDLLDRGFTQLRIWEINGLLSLFDKDIIAAP
jgi:hypothetical protein